MGMSLRDASQEATGRLITQQEIAEYHDKGVVVCKEMLPRSVVEQWLEAWLQLKKEIAAGSANVSRSDRFIGGAALPDPIGSIYRDPILVDAATSIIGPDVALYFNRLLVKDTEWNGDVGPHQDCVYFHGSTAKLSVFVPLAEFTLRTGAVKFVEGSHKYGNLGRRATLLYDKWEAMPLLVPDAYPGDVLLASFETWHHSSVAEVPSERPLVQIAYQNAADGSYYGEPNGPVLVAGDWRTKHFSRYLHGIEPHA